MVLPSPHNSIPTPFLPLINKTDLQMQLWKQSLHRLSSSIFCLRKSRQARLTRDVRRNNASNSLTDFEFILRLLHPPLLAEFMSGKDSSAYKNSLKLEDRSILFWYFFKDRKNLWKNKLPILMQMRIFVYRYFFFGMSWAATW